MTTKSTQAALAAIARVDKALQAADAARDDRDVAIAGMFREGMRPPQIAEALDMTVSNVRHVLTLAGLVGRRAGRD